MKTLEESARNADAREKALKHLNAYMHDIVAIRARVTKAQKEFDSIESEAQALEVAKLQELDEEMKQREGTVREATRRSISNAKSALGTATSELAKITKRYTMARARLTKLLPPEDITMEPKTNGATDDRSHAIVG